MKAKNSPNQTARTQNVKTDAEKALETIDSFLQENESYSNGLAWHLHCFCRRGNSERLSFDIGTLEFTCWFIDNLIKTFMNPKGSQLYCKLNNDTPEGLGESLMALKELFTKLADDPLAQASIERIEAGYFGKLEEDRNYHSLRLRYERARDLAFTKSKIVNYYSGQFKQS